MGAGQALDQLPDLDDLFRVQPQGRLIQDQHRRIVEQRLSQPDPLLVPSREIGDQAVAHVAQRQALHHAV